MAQRMVRDLIKTPIRLAIAVAGGFVGAVRSAIGGADPDRDTVEGVATEVPREPVSESKRESIQGREPEESGWDAEAPVPPGGSSADDLVIADRVKSEVLGVAEAPKGDINLTVENGVVLIRGHLDDPDQVDELVTLAGAVEGVVGVENLLGSGA